MALELCLILTDRAGRHVGDRHDHVDLLADDEVGEECFERAPVDVRRWIGDVADAVFRRGREAGRPFSPTIILSPRRPERAHDGERRR